MYAQAILLIALASMPHAAHAATLAECQKISRHHRPTTAEDAVVKNGWLEAGDCYNPATAGINQEGEAAKRYLLETRNACSGGRGISGDNPNNCILRLDAAFAVSLAKMFKENPGIFGGIKILSGYRTAEGEQKVSGKTTGNHRRGCAVDLTGPNSSNTACLGACQFIKANSARLKLAVPYNYSPEYNHVEPVGSCAGGDGAPTNVARSMSSSVPSAALAGVLRQALGLQAPLAYQQPFSPQPYAQAQPILSTFVMPVPAMPPSVEVTAAAPARSDAGMTPASGGVSDKLFTDTRTTATGTSPADTLNELAFGVSTGGATSGVPFVPLVINPDDRSGHAVTTTKEEQLFATRTPSITTDTTFLGDTPNLYQGETTSRQGFARILTNVKATLLTILELLQPFSARRTLEVENRL